MREKESKNRGEVDRASLLCLLPHFEAKEREKKQRLRVTEGKYIHKERDKIENAKGVEEIEKERKTEAERNRGWK